MAEWKRELINAALSAVNDLKPQQPSLPPVRPSDGRRRRPRRRRKFSDGVPAVTTEKGAKLKRTTKDQIESCGLNVGALMSWLDERRITATSNGRSRLTVFDDADILRKMNKGDAMNKRELSSLTRVVMKALHSKNDNKLKVMQLMQRMKRKNVMKMVQKDVTFGKVLVVLEHLESEGIIQMWKDTLPSHGGTETMPYLMCRLRDDTLTDKQVRRFKIKGTGTRSMALIKESKKLRLKAAELKDLVKSVNNVRIQSEPKVNKLNTKPKGRKKAKNRNMQRSTNVKG